MVKQEICERPKASKQPFWLRCLAIGRVSFPGSYLTTLKNEFHGQQKMSIEIEVY
jgi:hypothetical protein